MKKTIAFLTLALVSIGFYGFISFSGINPKTEKIVKGYEIGDEATDFKLKNVDGRYVSLADFTKAKGFIVVFTCNHCPYAKMYEDRIIALNKKYKELGYPVIAINPNDPDVQPQDSFENMQKRAIEKDYGFPYLLDEGQKIYPQYGATKTPHVFILAKEKGKNIVKYIGTIDNNYEDANDVSERYVEAAVDALLKGESIKTTKTVAIGCSIKTK
ncbi:thioredoxin family protein [Mesonia sp. K7]|uniref:thioredoxin family protein n=1 Tax=Mesonia sp. K7 TaxID=2218606 RepID=UPI000DA6FA6E|nr:thioredoxin family protein [Mesonia sp. K7]PZD79249.1 thioredoxin family protein [Mesonia sp. K7]